MTNEILLTLKKTKKHSSNFDLKILSNKLFAKNIRTMSIALKSKYIQISV